MLENFVRISVERKERRSQSIISREARDGQIGGHRVRARTGRMGKSISNSILSTRDVDDVTGELGDVD